MPPSVLKREIRQRKPFTSLAEEAFLNLQRGAGVLLQEFTRFLKPWKLTPATYNSLRILRGAHPEVLPCGEVGERLVTPEPDVTRLIDRLERLGLVQRERDGDDRRVVRVTITASGLAVLAELDDPVRNWLKNAMSRLPATDLRGLVGLLERLRG